MKKISCNIVKDILPLYLDDIVSNDTKELVEEHLSNCEDCRKEATLMKKDVVLPINESIQRSEGRVLKKMKTQIHRKKIATAMISVVVAVAVIVGLCFMLTVSKTYIPYDNTQFEIKELDGKMYAYYYGKSFAGSVSLNPVSMELDGEQKNVVVFYSYNTALENMKSYFGDKESSDGQIIYLGNANEMDAIYYGEFDSHDTDIEISTVVEDSTLIWSD